MKYNFTNGPWTCPAVSFGLQLLNFETCTTMSYGFLNLSRVLELVQMGFDLSWAPDLAEQRTGDGRPPCIAGPLLCLLLPLPCCLVQLCLDRPRPLNHPLGTKLAPPLLALATWVDRCGGHLYQIWEGRGFEKEKSDADTWCRVHTKTQSACHLRRMWGRACWDQCLHPRQT